jgi:predicted AAA+ superfamily ATPase
MENAPSADTAARPPEEYVAETLQNTLKDLLDTLSEDDAEKVLKTLRQEMVYTQFQPSARGYIPTGRTVKRLPAGFYLPQTVREVLHLVPQSITTDNLIRLPDSRGDKLLDEVKNFRSLKEELKNGNAEAYGGYLRSRGYLLHGPPGSGKTSLVQLLVKDVIDDGGICLLGNTHPSILVAAISALRQIDPNQEIVVVFEDFDALIDQYKESEYLSLLSGEDSADNCLFIATTNYVEKLDQRIYNRPGRFNDRVYIGLPSEDGRRIFLRTKLKSEDTVVKVAAMTDGFTLDHLRALIIGVFFEKKDLEAEIDRLRKMFKPPKGKPDWHIGIGEHEAAE